MIIQKIFISVVKNDLSLKVSIFLSLKFNFNLNNFYFVKMYTFRWNDYSNILIFATNLKQRSNTISTFVKKIPSAHHALTKPLPNLKKKSTSPIQQQVDKKSSKQLFSNQACIIPTPQFFIWNYLFNVAQNCITLWSPCRKKKRKRNSFEKTFESFQDSTRRRYSSSSSIPLERFHR